MGKILILSDVPPCKKFSGALLTCKLARTLPRGLLVNYSVVNPALGKLTIDDEFKDIPVKYIKKPNEHFLVLILNKLARYEEYIKKTRITRTFFDLLAPILNVCLDILSYLREIYVETFLIPKITKDIIKFTQVHKVEKIWAILQGQTMITIAHELSVKTKIPLHSQVWDSFEWFAKATKIDRFTTKIIYKKLNRVLQKSKSCACASWEMAEKYINKYKIPCYPVISGIDKSWKIKNPQGSKDVIIIAMAGQIYAGRELLTLLDILDELKWNFEGKKIIFRYLGYNFLDSYFSGHNPRNIEYMGYRPQRETIKILSECDLLYCPYWFDLNFKEECSTSFPSKLSTYLAAGRLVLFHGPDYASPSKFLERYDAGVLCNQPGRDNLKNCLLDIMQNPQKYSHILKNAEIAFDKYLTTDYMKEQFSKFIN